MQTFFQDKQILIIGGTGSIGSDILRTVSGFGPRKIRIFSRDEYKQHVLRYKYHNVKNIEYTLGDVRDLDSLIEATKGTDIIFHCAALKHVPISEEMPEEFIKTNILGSLNVKKAALINQVPVTVSISTDKAVHPTNVMGLTKAVQEKIFSSHFIREKNPNIKFVNVRFGNVIGTHGSLFPIIYHQIKNKQPITITEPVMTRFFMSEQEAIDLILWATLKGKDGEIIIKNMKSVEIRKLVDMFLAVLKIKKDYPRKYIGVRIGEKMHESLITEDEIYRTKESDGYFIVSPYTPGEIRINIIKKKAELNLNRFSSDHKRNLLSDRQLKKYITNYIQEAIAEKDYI